MNAPAGRPLRVLMVEDSEEDAMLVLRELRRAGFRPDPVRVETAEDMRARLEAERWDIILSDYSMPRFNALAAYGVLASTGVDVPFIIVSGTVGEDVAVEAMRLGVSDYLLKGNLTRLGPAIDRELRDFAVREARRRAELELRESEERYRALFEFSPLPTWVFDKRTRMFVAVNDAALVQYGYTRDELSERSVDVFRSMSASDSFDGSSERAEEGTVMSQHCRKDGSIMDVELKAHDVQFSGLTARLVVANDVTARRSAEEALRRAETQLRQSQKLEAIGSLAGGVAHDFNNVLCVILSLADLLLRDLQDSDPIRADIVEIKNAGVRAAELTRQLLAFGRQQMLVPRILDLGQVVGGMEKMLRHVLRANVDISISTSHALGSVRADAGQIEQVIMNLVVNARDAMPRGGTILVDTRNMEVDEAYAAAHPDMKPGPYVALSVTDSGTGMDAATQSRIFEPFFTTKPQGEGTGLGLATVFGIIKQSGGTLWVDSHVGQGTKFEICLPRVGGVAAPMTELPPALVGSLEGTETVLLVEDEDAVRAAIRSSLRRYGYKVIDAQNGGEAFLICEKHSGEIDLLVTDVVMPRMSGIELAERVVTMRPKLKVLYLSGYTPHTFVHDGDGLTFLQKPVTPEVLARKVREVLERAF